MYIKSIWLLGFAALGILLVEGCKKDEIVSAPPVDYGSITTIHYSEHVQPLLSKSCARSGCHNAATKAAGLSLPSWDECMDGSSNGEAVIPFASSRSLLTSLFDGTQLRKQHPALNGPALSDAELQFLKRWIDEGARNDAGTSLHSTNRLYVPDQAGDDVAIVDIDRLVVTRYVDVGNSPANDAPHFVAANQQFWYVSLIGGGEVWKFDAQTDSLVGTVAVPGSPALLALTPDGSKLYVSQFTVAGTNNVTVVNTAGMTVTQSIHVWTMPHGIRMNHSGTLLYVANMMSDNISVIDVATDSVLQTVQVAYDSSPFGPTKYMPMELAVSPNDNFLLVTCSEQQEVRMFDLSTNTLVDSFHVGDQPWHLQFTADGQFCYVANRRGNSVSVIDIAGRHVLQTIVNGSPQSFAFPHGCDISADSRYIFVSNENIGQGFIPRYTMDFVGNVCVIDRSRNEVIKVLEVGRMPTGISVSQ